MEQDGVGANMAVWQIADRWERNGERPVTDDIMDPTIKKEKLGILRPKIKEGLNNVTTSEWKKLKF